MPGPLNTFIGNAAAVRGLRTNLRGGRLAHAYLFSGPSQVGKRTLARSFAAALLCNSRPGADPPGAALGACGTCRSCLLVEKHTHPDVRIVEPEAGKRGVTIEQVRQFEHAASLKPYEGDRKVFVLVGADTMPDAAANALLKTLEEPPDDTILILTASDVSQVLPTIVSRCREVPLRPVPVPEIVAALAARGLEPMRAERIARLAAGRPGWALAAAEDETRLAAHTAQIETLEGLLAQPRARRLQAAGTFGDASAAKSVLDVWLGWWRDALLVQQGCADLVANTERLDRLQRLGAAHAPETVWRAMQRVQETRQQLDANANVRLAVEALLLDLPEAAGSTAVT